MQAAVSSFLPSFMSLLIYSLQDKFKVAGDGKFRLFMCSLYFVEKVNA